MVDKDQAGELPPPARLAPSARYAIAFLTLAGFVDALSVVADLRVADLLGDAIDGVGISPGDAKEIKDFADAVDVARLVVFVLAAAAFLAWFRQAYRNLPRLGFFGLRFTTGYAVGAWFAPIFNLFWPKQIANDIWRASDPQAADDDGERWSARPVATLVHLWWGLYLARGWGAYLADKLIYRSNTFEDARNSAYLAVALDAVGVLAAVVAIVFVRALTDRQDALIAREAA